MRESFNSAPELFIIFKESFRSGRVGFGKKCEVERKSINEMKIALVTDYPSQVPINCLMEVASYSMKPGTRIRR